MPEKWYRLNLGEVILVAGQIVLMVLAILGPRSPFSDEPWPAPWGLIAKIAGIALAAFGGLLASDGALRMGSNLTPSPRPRDGAPMLVHGAYRLVRHPMYSGLILAAFGWALYVNGPLTLVYAFLLFAWLDLKTRHEERLLEQTYDGYADYRSRVRKLVPFVY